MVWNALARVILKQKKEVTHYLRWYPQHNKVARNNF